MNTEPPPRGKPSLTDRVCSKYASIVAKFERMAEDRTHVPVSFLVFALLLIAWACLAVYLIMVLILLYTLMHVCRLLRYVWINKVECLMGVSFGFVVLYAWSCIVPA